MRLQLWRLQHWQCWWWGITYIKHMRITAERRYANRWCTVICMYACWCVGIVLRWPNPVLRPKTKFAEQQQTIVATKRPCPCHTSDERVKRCFLFSHFFAANNSLLSSRCAAFVAIHFIAFLTFILYSLLLFFFRFRSRVGISFVNFIKIARASCQKQSKTTDTPTPTRLAVDLNMPQPLYFCCFTAFFGKICHGLCP